MLKQVMQTNAPTVGMKGPIGSWITAFKSITSSNILYREGYEKYKSGSFTVRQIGTGNMVLVADEKMRDELRKAPEHTLSMKTATRKVSVLCCWQVAIAEQNQNLATDYTMGTNIMDNEYHAGLVTTHVSTTQRRPADLLPAASVDKESRSPIP
jgi:hypothetical protein